MSSVIGGRRGALLVVVAALVAAPSAAADPIPPDATWEEAYIESGDGTRLHADVFRPDAIGPGERTPVIVIVSPYIGIGNTGGGVLERPQILDYYRDLFAVAFRRGYSIVQVALRGQGASDGCPDLGGPGEQADARAAVRWSATRRWSTGRVGSWGLSWDGYTQVMNLANRTPGLEAAVIAAPVTDLWQGYFMNGVGYVRAGVAGGYYYSLLGAVPPLPATVSDLDQIGETAAAAVDAECAPQVLSNVRDVRMPDRSASFWRQRDMLPRAARSRVPVLLSQGFLDEQTYAEQFMPLWRGLRGPKRAWFGQFPHLVASEAENGHPTTVGRQGFTAEAMRWFDAYLKRRRGALRAVKRDPRVEIQEGSAGLWRSERRWPPRDVRRTELRVHPGPYFDGPGSKAEPYCTRLELHCVPGVPGVFGAWTLTEKLPHAAHLAGAPSLEVTVDVVAPQTNLIATLYDIDTGNLARLVSRGAYLLPGDGTYRFRLYPQDWRFEPGHRLGLFVSGADDDWFMPGQTLTPVEVRSGRLELPFLRRERVSNLEGEPSDSVRHRAVFPFPEQLMPAWTVDSAPPPPMKPSRPASG